jgi:hypothetical protein
MSHRNMPVSGPDAGHDYPLVKQGNMDHVLVVMEPGTTDAIISRLSAANSGSQNTNPVWQFPAYNRDHATDKAA